MRKAISEKHKRELLEVIQNVAKERHTLDAFLEDLLTPNEYQALATRWQIVQMLAEGKTQREISELLKTGIETVSRGSRELRDMRGAFMKLLHHKFNTSWQSPHSF